METDRNTPANIDCFRPPRRAETLRYAAMGILNPAEEDLSPVRYARLYRLGHSSLPDAANISSPWWSDFQAVQALRRFAEMNSVSMTISSRIGNAQAPEFGPADILYTIDLALPVRTLRGLGRPIESGGRLYAPPREITQTYVPGLRDWSTKGLSATGRRVIASWRREVLPKGTITLYGE